MQNEPVQINKPVIIERPVIEWRASIILGMAIAVMSIGVGLAMSSSDRAHAALEPRAITPLIEEEQQKSLPKATAWQVCSDGNRTAVSWQCHSTDPTLIFYRGGSSVTSSDGTPYCSDTTACPAGAVAAGDSVSSYLYTAVDAGVTLDCLCASP